MVPSHLFSELLRTQLNLVAIDDDPAILMLLEMALNAGGHEVISVLVNAQTPNDLIEELNGHQIDGIILDYRLPKIDAIELKKQLCKALKLHRNSVIFLTASPESLTSEHPYIAKPFSPLQISDLVCDMLSKKALRTSEYDG